MNVPNLLSIFRLFITIFFILAVYHDRLNYALYLFILQGITDLLDGFIARVFGLKTTLGAFLDPLADKTMLIAAFVMLSFKNILPSWLLILVLLRDMVIAGGFLFLYRLARTVKPVPTILGKITTVSQIAVILYFLWFVSGRFDAAFIYAAAFFTVISGCHYVLVGIRLLRSGKVDQSPAN
ncbi:MAG TPA: CDP-alcohol phosphatidyltransferase family protein [Syntrophorhabdaceae bacterium]|nr:CDP-alcohol phosphatidyltransferase family protein [Syntrophorhabdaceae bacterium]